MSNFRDLGTIVKIANIRQFTVAYEVLPLVCLSSVLLMHGRSVLEHACFCTVHHCSFWKITRLPTSSYQRRSPASSC